MPGRRREVCYTAEVVATGHVFGERQGRARSVLDREGSVPSYRSAGGAVSDAQLDQYNRILSRYEDAMHVDNVDGFFSALICSPITSPPVGRFPMVFGGKMPAFDSRAEAEEVTGALLTLWNRAAHGIKTGAIAPVFHSGRDRSGHLYISAHQWAFAFHHGMEVHSEQWTIAMDKGVGELLYPIMMILEDGFALMEVEEANEGLPLEDETREELTAMIPSAVLSLYHYWRPREGAK